MSGGALLDRLENPEEAVSLSAFRERFHYLDIMHHLPGLGSLAGAPSLLMKLRGALGHRLYQSASQESRAGEPCPWQPPCAHDMLFRKQGRLKKAVDFPSPWIIQTHRVRHDLRVTLRLFGFAIDYGPAAAEAMGAALQHDIDYRALTGMKPSSEMVADRRLGMVNYEPANPAANHCLTFNSPVAISNNSPLESPASLVKTLAVRLEGMARWYDCDLVTDLSALGDIIAAAQFEWQDPLLMEWERYSMPQKRRIPMAGHLGQLQVASAAPAMATLLSMGAAVNMGADIAFGLGHYDYAGQD
ncbi:MAG: CRISPR system precrRNA processing endoribonuclease RAMP protein Cas6 [Pseudomonadota bacterium]